MVPGVGLDADPRGMTTDELLERLDRFLTTPQGSLLVVLVAALIRVLVDRALSRRRPPERNHRKHSHHA